MSSDKISIVWLPGAWHGPEHFEPVGKLLEGHGYTNVYQAHPAVGSVVQDPYEDCTAARKTIESELAKGNDVIVVCHSYGGVVATNASIGLGKKEREARGEKNGIINIVFMCAFALPKGVSLWDALGRKPLPWFVMDDTPEYLKSSNESEIFYNDLPSAQAEKLIAGLKPHSFNVFTDCKVTEESYRAIPSSYLICTLDNAIPLPLQENMVQQAQPDAFQLVERIEASHSPFYSKTAECANFIRKAAGETV